MSVLSDSWIYIVLVVSLVSMLLLRLFRVLHGYLNSDRRKAHKKSNGELKLRARIKSQSDSRTPIPLFDLSVSLEQLYKGDGVQLKSTLRSRCEDCVDGIIHRTYGSEVCSKCDGNGTQVGLFETFVNLSKGLRDGDRVTGTAIRRGVVGGTPEHAEFIVRLEPQNKFKIYGTDLECTVDVTNDARAPKIIEIALPDGSLVSVDVPFPVESERRIWIEQRGMPTKDSSERGMLFVLFCPTRKTSKMIKEHTPYSPRLDDEETLARRDAQRRRNQRDFRLNVKKRDSQT